MVWWQVRQKQHDLAMAVVMDSNMDAVIVDKEETVRRYASSSSLLSLQVLEGPCALS